MSRLPLETKEKALSLRSEGYSVKEIADKLDISKSTSSLWVSCVKLNRKAQQRLGERKLLQYYKSSLSWERKRTREEEQRRSKALEIISKIKKDPNHLKIYCALLYWCEGGKGYKESVRFVNSDPILISAFLTVFRKSFEINERKLRVLMHLHGYHDEEKQRKFWSNLTEIPENQFLKTFHKPHTSKRIKKDYPGCVAIHYNDFKIAREIRTLYKVFSEQLGM